MASYTEDKKSPGIFSTLHSEQTEKQDTVFESRRLAEHAYVRIHHQRITLKEVWPSEWLSHVHANQT